MAGKSAILTVKILTDAASASKGLDDAAGSVGKFQSGINKMVPAAAATVAAIAGIGAVAVDAASRTEQAMGAVDKVFGDSAGQVKAWSDQAAQSVGLAKSEYGELASTIGAQLGNMGLSSQEAASSTNDLITLGADLAATFGGSTADAVSALSAALRGEADPAEKFGLSLKETDINAKLAEQGLSGLTGEAAKTARTQAILALATEQAGGAVGAFAAESDTAAGAAQRNQAAWQDAMSTLGTALLPIVTAVTQKFAELAQWVSENSTLVLVIVGAIGTLAGIILTLSAAMKVATAVQWALNSAFLANPIVWIILLIAALVAAFILLWNNSEAFRQFFIDMWAGIQAAIAAVVEWFGTAWGAVVEWFKGVWAAVAGFFQSIWAGIQAAFTAVADFFKTVWNVAVAIVQAYFNAWRTVITTIINGVKAVVDGVANFFKSAWEGAVNAVSTVIRTLQGIFQNVFNAIMVPINAVKNAFDAVVGAIRNVINWISKIKIPDVLGQIGGIFGFSAAAPSAAAPAAGPAGAALYAAPRVIGGRQAVLAGGAGGITINVTGGLDSAETIARRIRRILTDHDRRQGGVSLARRSTV